MKGPNIFLEEGLKNRRLKDWKKVGESVNLFSSIMSSLTPHLSHSPSTTNIHELLLIQFFYYQVV